MRNRVLLFAVVAALAIAVIPAKGNQVLYTIVDLGAVVNCCGESMESSALSINNAGQVVGFTETNLADEDFVSPFIYENGTMTLISPLFGWATGINDDAQVTGFLQFPDRPSRDAFLYHEGVLTDLGRLPGHGFVGLPYSMGWGINGNGTIVGESKSQAMKYEDGAMEGFSRRSARAAYGINDHGDIVGVVETMAPRTHAFLLSDNNLLDLGTLDGDMNSLSIAMGVNNQRQVIGYSGVGENRTNRGFIYEGGVMSEVGTLNGGWSLALGINNHGDIIGESDGTVFVKRSGTMIDLNTAIEHDDHGLPKINKVAAINDRGQIVGAAYFWDAEHQRLRLHACVLTPVAPQ